MTINNETLDRLAAEELQLTEMTEERIEEILREAENNFKSSIQGHITYHAFLERDAQSRDDHVTATYHRRRRLVYQQILDNVSLSASYNKR
jgi:hypothetical protein